MTSVTQRAGMNRPGLVGNNETSTRSASIGSSGLNRSAEAASSASAPLASRAWVALACAGILSLVGSPLHAQSKTTGASGSSSSIRTTSGSTSTAGKAGAAAASSQGDTRLLTDPNSIKTIQRKNFLKVKRLELSPYLGTETVDIFMHHYALGVTGTYHLTEVFAIEGLLGWSPSLSDIGLALNMPDAKNFDLKDLTEELAENASVKPISSKIGAYGGVGMVFSPFYGKLAWMSKDIVNFDLYFMFGPGFMRTKDRDYSYDTGSAAFEATTNQTHATSHFGFGFRAAFNDRMAFKVEGREYIYVETLTRGDDPAAQDTAVKYYFMTQAGVSLFFP